jgi:hypothetical protein
MCLLQDELGKRPPAWGKLLAIRQALEEHEYALYLDLDIAIVSPTLSSLPLRIIKFLDH